MDNFSIFVVDDDPQVLRLFNDILAEDHPLETFTSAEACIQRMDEAHPEMLLLDVSLPGIDGYAFARQLKESDAARDIPITFISAHNTVEARLSAYDAGAEDFVTKPFQISEVLRKVDVARRIRADKHQLREQAGYAQQTAMTAISCMGELGVVIEFLRRSFACGSMQELASAVLAALDQYSLRGAVQMRQESNMMNLSPQGMNLPLETEVLNHVRSMGRIFEFKTRAVFNYGQITVLVNNMPHADPDRCGRIRDNLAILAEGADARLQAIAIEQKNQRKHSGVCAARKKLRDILAAVSESHQRDRVESAASMHELLAELDRSFVSLGLTDAQEIFLSELVQRYTRCMVGLHERDNGTQHQLENLASTLESLADPAQA